MNINNLHFGYTTTLPILNGLSLSLTPGHIVGLLGQNGAGKTTFLKLLAGLCFPSLGEINIFGDQPKDRHPKLLQELFFIPEDFSLPNLTLQQYAQSYGYFYPRFDHALFNRALQGFGLNSKTALPSLSHGQKKMFITAFAISTRAKVLILDEPSNGLDISNKQVWQELLMKEISEEQLVIISTHQVHDIANIIDSVLVMKDGKMLLNSSINELENKLYCGFQREAPEAGSVFYSEKRAGGYAILKENTGETHSSIDLELLFQACIKGSPIARLFSGEHYV